MALETVLEIRFIMNSLDKCKAYTFTSTASPGPFWIHKRMPQDTFFSLVNPLRDSFNQVKCVSLLVLKFHQCNQRQNSPVCASRLATTKKVVRGPVYLRKVLVSEWSAKTTPLLPRQCAANQTICAFMTAIPILLRFS